MMKFIDDLLPLSIGRPGRFIREPLVLVIHYVGNPNTSAKANRNYWTGSGTSAHFVIDMDGTIIRAVPESEQAAHVGTFQPTEFCCKILGGEVSKKGLQNQYCIGIELCHPTWTGGYTAATIHSLNGLLEYLTKDKRIKWLATHKDITGKNCDFWFNENPAELDKLAANYNLFTKRSVI